MSSLPELYDCNAMLDLIGLGKRVSGGGRGGLTASDHHSARLISHDSLIYPLHTQTIT